MGRLSEGMGNLAIKLDRRFGWHRLPTPFGLLVLAEMRKVLRDRNLFDTGQPTGLSVPQAGDDPEAARYLTGTFEVPVAYGDGNGDGESEPRYVELADDRRHVQRSREPLDGQYGHPLRP